MNEIDLCLNRIPTLFRNCKFETNIYNNPCRCQSTDYQADVTLED